MKKLGVRLLKVGGVPVYLQPSWFALMALVVIGYGLYIDRSLGDPTASFTVSVSVAFLIALGVLVHEVAHAVTGMARGLRVQYISMTLWGGVTKLTPGPPLSSIMVSLAGPIVNALYAVGLYFGGEFLTQGALRAGVSIAVEANLLISLFNLLPSYPLDGGHAVEACVTLMSGRRSTGAKVTAWCGLAMIPLLIAAVVYLGLWRLPAGIVLVGIFCFYLWSASLPVLRSLQLQAGGGDPLSVANLAEPALVLDEKVTWAEIDRLWDGAAPLVLLRSGTPVAWVSPDDLQLPVRGEDPGQLAHPLAPQTLPLDLLRLDLMEFFNGYRYRQLPEELQQGYHPIAWAVKDKDGTLIGLLQHRRVAEAVLREKKLGRQI